MKKTWLLVGLLAVAAPHAFAESEDSAIKNGPCKPLWDACEAGGYKLGAHKTNGKGLWVDCLDPLLAGKSVEGVTADASVVPACKEAKTKFAAERKEKRKERREKREGMMMEKKKEGKEMSGEHAGHEAH